MTWVIITYDLLGPGRGPDYRSLYDKIRAYDTSAHISRSSWIIFFSDDVDGFDAMEAVYDNLTKDLKPDDKLFVGDVTFAQWQGLGPEFDFMQEI